MVALVTLMVPRLLQRIKGKPLFFPPALRKNYGFSLNRSTAAPCSPRLTLPGGRRFVMIQR